MKIIHKEDRIGVIGENRFGSKMIVEEYNTPIDIWVRFIESNYKVHTTWRCFCLGSVKNPYDKTVHGIGFIGEGNYKVSNNHIYTPHYLKWHSMIQRCYSDYNKKLNPTYINCTVCEEWHNFQNFCKWYDENYYEVDGERMELDKDILVKGNKLYSPETCVFVPHSINILFIKRKAKRGDLPIGVSYNETRNKYTSSYGNNKGKQINGGYFNTYQEAFNVYKINKEKIIKHVAEEYKDKIPNKLFTAMIKYKVEIND